MQNKHQAGYYKANVNKDAYNYLRNVLSDKGEDEVPMDKRDILKKINEVDKPFDGESKEAAGKDGQRKSTEEPADTKKAKAPKIDPDILKAIEDTILDHSPNITWDDI